MAPTPTRAPAIAFAEDPRPLPRFHSKRFAMSLPLPDGAAWRIDDHTRPLLVATHAPTQSQVVAGVLRADTLVGRRECEALARERKLVPALALPDLHTLEDDTSITQNDFDTRTWVAVEPGAGPGRPIVGHVMAFGGFLRKCYVFDFATRVDASADEAVLSARLAFARARILGGLTLESFDAPPREAPATRDLGPAAPRVPSPGGAPRP